MTRQRDPRTLIWGLLGLWVVIELIYSSRWWPRNPLPQRSSGHPSFIGKTLRHWLERHHRQAGDVLKVWFAPYTTFPEPGYVESAARSGVYDTFLAIPSSGLAANYGANKLTPADTLFTLASSYGLAAELNLAKLLGYGFFVLDVGALSQPDRGVQLCKSTPGCVLSSDSYALFPIGADVADLQHRLTVLSRRMPQFLQVSGGPRWGAIVPAPLQWGGAFLKANPATGLDPWLVVPALPLNSFEIYRYPLDRYPKAVQPWLQLRLADVQLVPASDVQAMQVCIGPNRGPCSLVSIGPGVRRVAIGDLFRPGQVSRIEIVAIRRTQPGQSAFSLELRAPGAARALLVDAVHHSPFSS